MKRSMRALFFVALITLMLLPFSLPVQAFGFGGGPAIPQGEITEIPTDYIGVYGRVGAKPMTIFSVGCTPAEIAAALPDTIDGIIGATAEYAPCDVVWDQNVDTSVLGWVNVQGTLSPPPGCTIAAGVETVTYPVMLQQEGMQPVERVRQMLLYNRQMETYIAELLPLGGDVQTLKFLSLKAVGICKSGQYFECAVVFDLSTVDPTRTGAYPVIGLPVLPACFSAPEGFAGFSATVYVGDPSGIDLSAVTQISKVAAICEWQAVVADPENMCLQYAVGSADGPWTDDPVWATGNVAEGTKVTTEHAWYTGKELGISLASIPYDTHYYFRIKYNDTYSNILSVDTVENDLPSASGVGGDRDGGDRSDQPAASQEPQTTQSAAPAPTPKKMPEATGTQQVLPVAEGSAPPKDNAAAKPDGKTTQRQSESEAPDVEQSNPGHTGGQKADEPAKAAVEQQTSVSDGADTAGLQSGEARADRRLIPGWMIGVFAGIAALIIVWLVWKGRRNG